MTFEEYYKSIGLKEYPFSVFNSEGERDIFDDIYLPPQNYSVILEGLRNTSAIIIGERGTGKTALSIGLSEKLSSQNNLLVKIEEFSDLKNGYDHNDVYKFLTERIVIEFFLNYAEKPSALWKLSKEDRIDLSMYLHNYLGASTKMLLVDKLKKIQNSPTKRFFIGLFNICRAILNYGLKAAITALNDAITKHFSSLPPVDIGNSDYFKKLEIEVDTSFDQGQRQFFYLEKICNLVRKAGLEKIYIFIDKVDEDPRFQNDAEDIADYLQLMASDNKILTSNFFQIIFFAWSTPFNYIRDRVRTQKISFTSLTWDRKSLEKVLAKRVARYTQDSLAQNFDLLDGVSENSKDLILDMCNRNPRDLWHIMDKLLQEQFQLDPSRKIGDDAVALAIKRFVIDFNYYEYYPRKSNARANTMDVYRYIKHLLKLSDFRFTKDRLNNEAGTGSSTNSYVVAMENMGLIRNTQEKAQGGAVLYEIADPKVRYAMHHGFQISD